MTTVNIVGVMAGSLGTSTRRVSWSLFVAFSCQYFAMTSRVAEGAEFWASSTLLQVRYVAFLLAIETRWSRSFVHLPTKMIRLPSRTHNDLQV